MAIEQNKNIHWFPGHMKKALVEIESKIKLIDLVIEVLDSRAPFSSRNRYFLDITKSKRRIIILNKKDLSDLSDFNDNDVKINDNDIVLRLNLLDKSDYDVLFKTIKSIHNERVEKYQNKGMNPPLLRALIIGIPNVGKSSLINFLNKKYSAPVGNTPGYTRAEKWIKVDNLFYLLDTPGILPANYEEDKTKINLALIGSMKQEILPIDQLANYLMDIIKDKYFDSFIEKYSLEVSKTLQNLDIFDSLAVKRGYLLKNGERDINKAQILLLNDFKNGKICKVYLD